LGRKKKSVNFETGSVETSSTLQDVPSLSESFRKRMAIPLNESGDIDTEKISADDLEKIKAAFQQTVAAAETTEEILLGDDEANALLDLLSRVEAFGASKIYKIPREITDRAFVFNELHRKKLNPPLIKVANKWAPYILKKWKDEIGLAIIFGSVINAQTRAMHMLNAQAKAAEKRPPAPISILTPEKPDEVADTAKTNA
jgi:hypothetical protein